jgi:hypothetical protein
MTDTRTQLGCKDCKTILASVMLTDDLMTASFVEAVAESHIDDVFKNERTLPMFSKARVVTQINVSLDEENTSYAVQCRCKDSQRTKIRDVNTVDLAQLARSGTNRTKWV